MTDDNEPTEVTADQQMRIAGLNAAIAMGITHPRNACLLAEKLMDWIQFGDLPNPYPGDMEDQG